MRDDDGLRMVSRSRVGAQQRVRAGHSAGAGWPFQRVSHLRVGHSFGCGWQCRLESRSRVGGTAAGAGWPFRRVRRPPVEASLVMRIGDFDLL
jgi:hypothetical protein